MGCMRVNMGVIGCGAMAATMMQALYAAGMRFPTLTFLVPQGSAERVRDRIGTGQEGDTCPAVVTTYDAFMAARPDIVVECASQQAVMMYGADVLAAGVPLALASVGALADDDVRTSLQRAASLGGTRYLVAPGAIGALDVLVAARLSGLREVIYHSRKPPQAWRGTLAEQKMSLDTLSVPEVFFDGTARAAALDYPKNANVAAAIALAGVGFEKTRVRLIADPGITGNIHEIVFDSGCTTVSIRLEGRASPDNPRTSQTAGYSLARLVINHVTCEVI